MRCLLVMALALSPLAASEAVDVRDAIVKIYTIANSPDYYNPWAMRGPMAGTGSGCVIKGKRILTNAHVVGNQTFIQVRRYGDAKRYQARVLSVSHEADLALLTVDDPDFFTDVPALDFGDLPEAQDEVLVYGFPLGGDTLSITKGVISRIEHQKYVHSSCNLLAGQIDAAINPGNSGGPVLISNKIVGVVMQGISQAENIGYMVPVNIINHFFKDLEDGQYDGFPSLGLNLQAMENPDMKRKYGLNESQSGLLIVHMLPGSPSDGRLREMDVLVAVDGHAIADDGTVEFRPRQRTSVSYFIQEKQIGEAIEVDVLRSGVVERVSLPLNRSLTRDWLVPMDQYDVLPSYYIYGGIVFCPLTKNLLKAWGPNWIANAPIELKCFLTDNIPEVDGEQVVLILKVLAADLNQGYHEVANWVVEEVNGTRVRNMRELVAALEKDDGEPFVTIRSPSGQTLVLDRKKARETRDDILKTYRIVADRSPDLMD